MATIDPQEFGRLQAQVETLIRSDAEKTELLRQMAETMTAMRLEMSEARGGWKVLLLLGGASATLGSGVTWILSHMIGRGVP